MTTILPTSRAIRAQMLIHKDENALLPRYITIGEFLQRAVVVNGYRRVDTDSRTLLLLEASEFSQFEALQIERNFFTFTQNASYLFRFFEELSGELINIGTLELADTYGDYEEHITILSELYRRYESICEEKRILDPIFLPKQYRLHESYIRSLGSIRLIAEGYLTNFEMQLLLEAAKIVPLQLLFGANRFNIKMQEKFTRLGMEIECDQTYRIDLSNRKIIEQYPSEKIGAITAEPFSERLLQIAFIKQKVYEFIEKGIAPERIAVVLPDEGFAKHLKHFDTENNFNFAMGSSLEDSECVRKLEAVMAYLDNSGVENQARLNRSAAELLEHVVPHYKADVASCDFNAIVAPFTATEQHRDAIKIIEEELYLFSKLLPALSGSPLKSALYLFVKRLKARSVDDVRGGKITVMGVLETRHITFDGVIVVDFNEGIVPRQSEKDLFLNSATRIKAGLPGSEDRQALQKLYYHNLFVRAKEVAIGYVEAADAVPTRFMTQLGISHSDMHDDLQWASLMLKHSDRAPQEIREITAEYDFTQHPLSATGLKTFLSCKRRFYHRYVEGLKEHKIAKDLPEEHEIGTALHYALRDLYKENDHFTDRHLLKRSLELAIERYNGNTSLEQFLHKLWMQRLDAFIENEIERFKAARVVSCEENLRCRIGSIELTGQIDRIDQLGDMLEVLDYKSGSYPTYSAKSLEKAVDFQLEFYYLLAQQKGRVGQCGYYDLKKGKIVYESLLNEKLQLLTEHLKVLESTKEFAFDLTDDYSECRYCEFAHLCQREL